MNNKLKSIIDDSYNQGKYEMANKVLLKIMNGDSITDIKNFLMLYVESCDAKKEKHDGKRKIQS